MNERRIAGLVRLYFHNGLPPNITVIVYDARRTWDNSVTLISPKHQDSLYRLYTPADEMMMNEIVEPNQEDLELVEMTVEGVDVMAGYSDRLQVLCVAKIRPA